MSQKLDVLAVGLRERENAVMLVPQASQPPQSPVLSVETVRDISDARKTISTYYPRCFKKGSATATQVRNCEKVLKNIAFVLPFEQEKIKIDDLKNKQNAIKQQLRSITKNNTNVQLRRV